MYVIALEGEPQSRMVSLDELADRLDREIDHLERLRSQARKASSPADRQRAPLLPQEIQRELQFLRQLSAGLACGDPGPIWYDRVGYGTVLLARDLGTGRERFYKIMMHRLDPLDLAQVTLSSDLGQAFHGRRAQEEVETDERCGRTRLRIMTLKTLPERLRMRVPATGSDFRVSPAFERTWP
jgi:transcription elongation GreA/GreB family factor